MKELITIEQANTIMLSLIVIAPVIGAGLGALKKQTKLGLIWGIVVGVVNFALWEIYNAITNRLGLDTVKNLLVNLVLFIVIGIVAGVVSAKMTKKPATGNSDSGGSGGSGAGVLVGGPVGHTPGDAKTFDEADEPPRNGG